MANKKYTKEFKLDAVRLALSSDKSQAQVARDLGIRENALYNWVSQYRGEVLGGRTWHDPGTGTNRLAQGECPAQEGEGDFKKSWESRGQIT